VGGGYSGGGGGELNESESAGAGPGGGGGSFDAGSHTLLVAGENGGNGSVFIAQVDTPTIGGTVANQTATGTTPIDPFSGVVISDPNLGTLPETVTVTPSSTTNGTLSDPNAATDGSSISSGVYTVTGTAAQVQADLRALVFTPAATTVDDTTTTFSVNVTNVAGKAATDNTTSVTDHLPVITSAPTTISYTGVSTAFSVSTAGDYYIVAYGAEGGQSDVLVGGRGAEIGGEFSLTANEVLTIAVGGAGGRSFNGGAGGGGGTFVVDASNNALVIAGGGGGDSGTLARPGPPARRRLEAAAQAAQTAREAGLPQG
jgi:hypothetical protein